MKKNAGTCFRVIALCLFMAPYALALDMSKVEVNFLREDYNQAIKEAELILVEHPDDQALDRVYYFLGLSYLKIGNYLRAGDIFEIIINEYPDSKLHDEAYLANGDSCFLLGNLNRAEDNYKVILKKRRHSRLRAAALLKMLQVSRKKGDWSSAKTYLDSLSKEYPGSMELSMAKEEKQEGNFFSVQAGAFLDKSNAERLIAELKGKNVQAYMAVESDGAKLIYKVRSGRFVSRIDALALEKKLKELGYSTRICP